MAAKKDVPQQIELTIHLPGLERVASAGVTVCEAFLLRLSSLFASTTTLANRWLDHHLQRASFAFRQQQDEYQEARARARREELALLKAEGHACAVWLVESGPRKIEVIKVIRTLTNLGLKEAKDLTDFVPKPVLLAVTAEDAERALGQLREAGATAEVRPA